MEVAAAGGHNLLMVCYINFHPKPTSSLVVAGCCLKA
ncbi:MULTISPECIES: ATP-binding protein [unclassified Mesorhizobium]|nr:MULTISPECIES: ATP-binding protein [unclassified Mesorhizobium]